jgi:N-acetylglutamate synthase-like GNAT family acetyltransferase
MDIRIRDARDRDLSAVIKLLSLLHDSAEDGPLPPESSTMQRVWREILAAPTRTVLVAERGHMIVGTLDLLVVPNLTSGGSPWAVIENMVVADANRRGGVGKALMGEVMSRVRKAGAYKIQLLSRRGRAEAHEFYTSLGFEASAEGFRLYLTDEATA